MKMRKPLQYRNTADLKMIQSEKQWDLTPPHRQRKGSYPVSPGVTSVVHVHLPTTDGNVFVFQRNCGRFSCISGELEAGESFARAGKRELSEETGLSLRDLKSAGHYFMGVTPKGKKIFGETLFKVLSADFKPSDFNFNDEIRDVRRLSFIKAISLMRARGFCEAAAGLNFIKKKWVI